MKKFEIVDHTADVGLIAYGATREDVFINAATGMFSLITDLDRTNPSHRQEISIVADDFEELLITWLNELLYYFDAENLIFCRFEIVLLNRERLEGVAWGETVDLSRHEIKTAIKAATYHQIRFRKEEGGYSARIILDI